MDAFCRRQEMVLIKEFNERAWLAWHVAVLVRWNGKKKPFPKLEKLMQRPRSRVRTEQSQEQQMMIAKLICDIHNGNR